MKSEVRRPRSEAGCSTPAFSRLRQELVFFNHRGHGELAIVSGILNPHHPAFALHADAFGESNLGRKGQSESDGRSLGHGGVEIEADAACTDVANLRDFTLRGVAIGSVFFVIDGHRHVQRKSPRSTLLLLRLGHAYPPKWRETGLKVILFKLANEDALPIVCRQYHPWVSR